MKITKEMALAELARRELAKRAAQRAATGPEKATWEAEADADYEAMDSAQPRQNTGAIPAAIAGVVNGATFGFGDEIAGLKSIDLETVMFDPSRIGDKYREGRDRIRSGLTAHQEANPKSFLGGEIVGGMATAAIPGAAPATLGKTFGVGALGGAVSALGGSSADLTRGEVGQAVGDTLAGGAVGLVGTGVAHGAGKVISSVVNRFRGAKSAARTVARKTAEGMDELEAATQGGTRRDYYGVSREIEDEASGMIGEKFRFRPGQATGDPALALAEMKASNFPKTMSKAQAEETKQAVQSAKLLDMYVDKIAENPEMLGKSDVGKQLTNVLEKHITSLVDARSEAARPLYAAAMAATGEKKVIPTQTTRSVMARILDENKFAPDKITREIRSSFDKVEKAASEDGLITIQDVQNLRSFWTGALKGDVNIIEGLSKRNQRRLAGNVLKAIDSDLQEATQRIESKDAAEALIAANKVWRAHSEKIDDTITESVERILGVDSDAHDTITQRILAEKSAGRISGVFRILNESAPDMARQLRAQLLDDVLTRAGKPLRPIAGMKSIAAEEGVARLRYGQAINAVRDAEPQLLAAFAGDDRAEFALRRSFQLLKRLSFGPGIKGSSTASMLAQTAHEAGHEAATLASQSVGGGVTGFAAKRAARFVLGVLGDDKALNQVYSSPENIDIFNEALQAQLSGRAPKRTTLNAIAALSDVLGLQSSRLREDE